MEHKFTKGPLERKHVSGICIGIGTVGGYGEMTANSIIPDTVEEIEQMEADMQIYACAPEMLEMIIELNNRLDEFGQVRSIDDEGLSGRAEMLIKKATTI